MNYKVNQKIWLLKKISKNKKYYEKNKVLKEKEKMLKQEITVLKYEYNNSIALLTEKSENDNLYIITLKSQLSAIIKDIKIQKNKSLTEITNIITEEEPSEKDKEKIIQEENTIVI